MGAEYIPRNSLSSLARQYWRYGVYRVKTSRAHPGSMRRSHLLAPGVAAAAAAAALPLGPLRRLGRAALAVWFAAVVGMAMVEAWRADTTVELDATAGDVAALPIVFGAMHLAWGFGFLFGCVRFGPPVRALANLARRGNA
jgi:succinoglycan biosynthesis protein ExoA